MRGRSARLPVPSCVRPPPRPALQQSSPSCPPGPTLRSHPQGAGSDERERYWFVLNQPWGAPPWSPPTFAHNVRHKSCACHRKDRADSRLRTNLPPAWRQWRAIGPCPVSEWPGADSLAVWETEAMYTIRQLRTGTDSSNCYRGHSKPNVLLTARRWAGGADYQ